MEDVINRDFAVMAIEQWLDHDGGWFDLGLKQAVREIKRLPSADRPSGEWIPNPKIGWGETWVCSVCGEKTTSSVMGYPRYNYCPMCGVRMKGADDETDNI